MVGPSPGGGHSGSGLQRTAETERLGKVQNQQVEGKSNPLQYSCLESPVDRGAWWATVHGVAKSQTQLSTHTHTHTDTWSHQSTDGVQKLEAAFGHLQPEDREGREVGEDTLRQCGGAGQVKGKPGACFRKGVIQKSWGRDLWLGQDLPRSV